MSASVIDRFFANAGMVAMRAAWQCSIAPAPAVRGFSSIHVEAKLDRSDDFRRRRGDEARTTDHRSIHLRSILIADPRGDPCGSTRPARHQGILGAPCRVQKSWTDQLLRRSVR